MQIAVAIIWPNASTNICKKMPARMQALVTLLVGIVLYFDAN